MYLDLFVEKSNRTYADTLTAFGLARVLNDLMSRQKTKDRDIQIKDCDTYYKLVLQPRIEPTWLEILKESPINPLQAIPTKFYNEFKLPAEIPVVNWEGVSEYLQAAKGTKDKTQLPPKPDHLDILLTINPEAIQGYNGLMFKWWNARHVQPEIFALLFQLFSQIPNNLEEAISQWETINRREKLNIDSLITGQQLYNPDQGMGQHRAKADAIISWQEKPEINFWLVEWLRTVGYFEAAIPRLVGDSKKKSEDKDRKILVISPKNLTYAESGQILSKFQNAIIPDTPIRFDILAVLRYLDTLLTYFIEPQNRRRLGDLGRIKHRVVSGFNVAFYKKMGKARSLMNLAFIALPGWIEVYDEATARFFIGLVRELEQIAANIDEEHSDTAALLQTFRDFLSGDDITQFLKFSTHYAGYYMSKQEKIRYLKPLNTELVERIVLIMGKRYADIGDKEKYPGFHNIARAISESTVIAQWRKSIKDNTYEIRYGLNQTLARNASDGDKFLETLGEFIHTYNAETSRANELERTFRPMVESSDIGDVLRMMDEYQSPRMIAQLLIAFGYTFLLPKKSQEQE